MTVYKMHDGQPTYPTWTQAGYSGKVIPARILFNSTRDLYITKRGIDCYIVENGIWEGLCVPKEYADLYVPEEPPPSDDWPAYLILEKPSGERQRYDKA